MVHSSTLRCHTRRCQIASIPHPSRWLCLARRHHTNLWPPSLLRIAKTRKLQLALSQDLVGLPFHFYHLQGCLPVLNCLDFEEPLHGINRTFQATLRQSPENNASCTAIAKETTWWAKCWQWLGHTSDKFHWLTQNNSVYHQATLHSFIPHTSWCPHRTTQDSLYLSRWWIMGQFAE